MGQVIEWGSARAVCGVGGHTAFLMVRDPHLKGGLLVKIWNSQGSEWAVSERGSLGKRSLISIFYSKQENQCG